MPAAPLRLAESARYLRSRTLVGADLVFPSAACSPVFVFEHHTPMLTVDQIVMDAPLDVCFRTAADVERWPDVLPHYRWVRFHRKDGFGKGRVEMAARRSIGPLPYPVWWVSEMRVDESEPAVLYEHVDGITRGMRVVWSFEPLAADRTGVEIVHDWDVGPAWPLPRPLRKWIADLIIGPLFIHHVASRTLAGIRSAAETTHARPGPVNT